MRRRGKSDGHWSSDKGWGSRLLESGFSSVRVLEEWCARLVWLEGLCCRDLGKWHVISRGCGARA